ncbi:RusA family crossover junction endodeoxyribonuclease [Lysinibacillus sphaericus]|nr:RusA family crossover junction endodeoxyribonuclease [Lysinibacillus sphaericus]
MGVTKLFGMMIHRLLDSQIVEMNVRKFYSEQPRAEVTIEWGH